MKLSKFIELFDLHDALLDEIQYNPKLQICRLTLGIFVYPSKRIEGNSPEVIKGQLLINGVTYVQSPLQLSGLYTSGSSDGEILEASVASLENVNNGLEELKLAILVSDYISKTHDVYILLISGHEAIWQPYASSQA